MRCLCPPRHMPDYHAGDGATATLRVSWLSHRRHTATIRYTVTTLQVYYACCGGSQFTLLQMSMMIERDATFRPPAALHYR